MELSGELAVETLEALLPGRPIRSYPALLSTDADARAWARAGAPSGAVVAAGYQASPRGRAGLEWEIAEQGLSFSLVLRPSLTAENEGWLYVIAALGLADALGSGTTIEWPDEVRRDRTRVGAVGVYAELGAAGVDWTIVSVLVVDAPPPQAALLARIVEAVETRQASPKVPVLADYLRRCETIGKAVAARLVPLRPGGTTVVGTGVNVLVDGALLIETEAGTRIAVRPQGLGLLEVA